MCNKTCWPAEDRFMTGRTASRTSKQIFSPSLSQSNHRTMKSHPLACSVHVHSTFHNHLLTYLLFRKTSQKKLLQYEKLACYLFFKICNHVQIWRGFLFLCWCTKKFSLQNKPEYKITSKTFGKIQETSSNCTTRNYNISIKLRYCYYCTSTLPLDMRTATAVELTDIECPALFPIPGTSQGFTCTAIISTVVFVNDDENDDKNDENILNYRRRD